MTKARLDMKEDAPPEKEKEPIPFFKPTKEFLAKVATPFRVWRLTFSSTRPLQQLSTQAPLFFTPNAITASHEKLNVRALHPACVPPPTRAPRGLCASGCMPVWCAWELPNSA